jgi:hypothetical protein
MDLGGSLTYQLAATFSRDMMNNLARVVSSPLDEAIAASKERRNFRGSDSL